MDMVVSGNTLGMGYTIISTQNSVHILSSSSSDSSACQRQYPIEGKWSQKSTVRYTNCNKKDTEEQIEHNLIKGTITSNERAALEFLSSLIAWETDAGKREELYEIFQHVVDLTKFGGLFDADVKEFKIINYQSKDKISKRKKAL
jgi:hypothetical protein